MVRRGQAIGFIALSAGLAVAFLYTPASGGWSPCFSKQVLHVACPGCGLTRSVTAAARGDFKASVRWHAFGPVVLLAGLLLWAGFGLGLIRGIRGLPDFSSKLWTFLLLGWLGALLVYWGIRLWAGTTP